MTTTPSPTPVRAAWPRRRVHDLPTRLARARLVFLLGRRRPLFDWIALSLAAVVATALVGADLGPLLGDAPGATLLEGGPPPG